MGNDSAAALSLLLTEAHAVAVLFTSHPSRSCVVTPQEIQAFCFTYFGGPDPSGGVGYRFFGTFCVQHIRAASAIEWTMDNSGVDHLLAE